MYDPDEYVLKAKNAVTFPPGARVIEVDSMSIVLPPLSLRTPNTNAVRETPPLLT